MTHDRPLDAIVAEIVAASTQIDPTQVAGAAARIAGAKRVFLAGMGRSGFTSRAFANRLGHLGFSAHFVGEPTTPPIAAGDVLVVTSGSGETGTLVAFADKAHRLGAEIVLLTKTGSAGSRIGRLAAGVVEIPAASEQPGGSLFEQLAWLSCDAIVLTLRDHTGQTNEEMMERHGNLE